MPYMVYVRVGGEEPGVPYFRHDSPLFYEEASDAETVLAIMNREGANHFYVEAITEETARAALQVFHDRHPR